MDRLTVLIVEDDLAACQAFIDCVDKVKEISIVGVTNNATKALHDIKNCLPDVIILDLELHKGSGSGLDVLKGLQEINTPVLPFIIITTNNSSKVTYEFTRNLGADFIIYKHQDNYSEKSVIDTIYMMKDIIKSKTSMISKADYMLVMTPEQRQKSINKRISAELDRVGIAHNLLGRRYIEEAIRMAIDGNSAHICRNLAQKHQKSESSVERAMQNAINRAWSTADVEDLLVFFTAKIRSDKGVPSILEFVCFYANKIGTEY